MAASTQAAGCVLPASEVIASVQTTDEEAEMANAFATMATVLAHLFRYPCDEATASFFKELDVEDGTDLFMCDQDCRAGAATIQSYFVGEDETLALRKGSDDFHKLFVGPNKLLAAPWSSVYVDLGSLFGPTALAVARLFADNGFEIPEGKREPSDHIAYELAFLAEMQKTAAQSLDSGDRESARKYFNVAGTFKRDYLDTWSDDFLDAVDTGARVDLYRGVSQLTRGFLGLESEFLKAYVDDEEEVSDDGIHAV